MPGFEAISRAPQVSLSIGAQIVAAIGAGDYPPGAKLPPEAELARQFGVSRPSVREALAALQFAGYIESRKGYGSVIVRTSANMLSDPPIPPSAGSGREAVEVVENRLLVEPYALAVAAADPDRVALGEAHELIQGMRLAVDEPRSGATRGPVPRGLLAACPGHCLVVERAPARVGGPAPGRVGGHRPR